MTINYQYDIIQTDTTGMTSFGGVLKGALWKDLKHWKLSRVYLQTMTSVQMNCGRN